MMEHLKTDSIRIKKDNRLLLHLKALTQTDGKKPSMGSGFRGEIFFLKEDRISCLNFLNGKCTNPSRNYWHPPVCLNYNTSLNQVANMATNVQSDIEVDGRQ